MLFEKHVFCDSEFRKSTFYGAFSRILSAPDWSGLGSRAGSIGILRGSLGEILKGVHGRDAASHAEVGPRSARFNRNFLRMRKAASENVDNQCEFSYWPLRSSKNRPRLIPAFQKARILR